MQVPVKVIVNTDTKEYDIEIGTPPASSLIKKEAGVEKGAANPKTDKVADLKIEQIIKIAKMKETSLLGKGLKEKVKEIIGTCNSAGILVEGVPAFEAMDAVSSGAIEMGHGGPYYWKGKVTAVQYLSAVPFGLTPNEQNSWFEKGGGQKIADEIYKKMGTSAISPSPGSPPTIRA